ncbi:MAG TPA: asparagine synthase (glutamine-hydrolyzing) [Polyangiales bacterium]|nr:asparagine synthase (glutamine-hydrolyzing) [Polyangiales bacterium]
MCGVVGIYAYRDSASSVERDELRTMRDYMTRRGPDASGEWFSPDLRVGLAHRRLSIIDLADRAAQPMQTADGRLCITFNGEIYNYASLRDELTGKGYVFRTTSDTEVLLHLYAERGVEMFHALRGMYAFGLWDNREQRLLLARDPYGIKPLYYSDEGGTLRFASQVRALLAGGRVSRTPDAAGQVGFYLWGSVPEPFTTYDAIRSVPAGSFMIATARGPSAPRRHFSLAQCWTDASRQADRISEPCAVQEQLRQALRDSVAQHMVADVPVSAFLSGGIDSGALVGLMTEEGNQTTHAITLAFDEFAGHEDDETPVASAVARHYGVEHHVRLVTEREFREDLPKVFDAMDQPSIDGLNVWFVSKATAELGLKVAISGLGGDELFGGYPSFREIPQLVRAMSLPARIPGLGKGLRHALRPIVDKLPGVHPKLASVAEYGGSFGTAYALKRGLFLPWELDTVLPAARVEEGLARLADPMRLEGLLTPMPPSAFARVALLEAAQYMCNQLLRDADWASMAHSLEVRVPLVDHVLLRTLAPVLAGEARPDGKLGLALSPRRALPEHVRGRRKTGFSTPIARWLCRSNDLEAWRRVPSLARDGCPWARRFAYSVEQRLR